MARVYQSRCFCLCAPILAILAMGGTSGAKQHSFSVEDLGPDGMVVGFGSLAQQIAVADAAIVAEIATVGELRSVETVHPMTGQPAAGRALAMYSVAISDVLYAKTADGQPLRADDITIMGQVVGRDSAKEYLERRTPVPDGAACILFLQRRGESWEILNWAFQFTQEQYQGTVVARELRPKIAELRSASWYGPTVHTLADSKGVRPSWTALVEFIRTNGAKMRHQ